MRPHRNPTSLAETAQNYEYLIGLAQLNPRERARRDPDWGLNAAWQIDNGTWWNNEPYAEVLWPEQMRGPRREVPRERDIDDNAGMMRIAPLNLDKLEPGPVVALDINLPPFKVDYDSHEQLHQKLGNTVILIKNQPFQVIQTARSKGKFFLYVRQGERDGIIAYDDVKDCRGISPAYWMHRGSAYWVYRVPERQNSQGMSARNTVAKRCAQNGAQPASANFLVEALQMAKDIPYAPNLVDIITASGGSSLRLSHRVALFLSNKKGAPLGVEYCGRPLGLIVNHACKATDPLDLSPSWIKKDLSHVGLELTE